MGFSDICRDSVHNILKGISKYNKIYDSSEKFMGNGPDYSYEKRYLVKALAYLYKLDSRRSLSKCKTRAEKNYNHAVFVDKYDSDSEEENSCDNELIHEDVESDVF